MALSFVTPVLLLSMVALASATYGGGYEPKPDLKKPSYGGYGPKPDLKKPSYGGYGPKPDLKKSFLDAKEKLLSSIIGIQGFVYCKSGRKLEPIEGAVARITCLAVDAQDKETAPFSILSNPANEAGYFLATFSVSQLGNNCKLKECKAFLEYSPCKICKVPTNVNKGVTGALLSSFRLLPEKKMKLYSVEPFYYSSEPKPTVSNGY